MPRVLRRPWFWLLLLGLTATGVTGVFMKQQAAAKAVAKANVKPAVSPYTAIANGKTDVEGGIIPVAARRGGIVKEVYVQEGDEVVKDQILARQQDDELRLAADRARAQVDQARAQLPALEVQISSAKRDVDRMQILSAKNFVSNQQVDQALDGLRGAEANLAAQRAAVTTAQAMAAEAAYNLELSVVRAPSNGRIIRRYANPGSGASTLNVSNMFDLEPKAPRIIRAEVPEGSLAAVSIGQSVEIVPEFSQGKVYPGKVIRRAGLFGARKLQSDDPSERADDRVVEVVVSAESAPLLIGQRVMVKFLKPAVTTAAATAKPPVVLAAKAPPRG